MAQLVTRSVHLPAEIFEQILAALKAYDVAAEKFIGKVDSGRAMSVETYRELKAARELSRKAVSLP